MREQRDLVDLGKIYGIEFCQNPLIQRRTEPPKLLRASPGFFAIFAKKAIEKMIKRRIYNGSNGTKRQVRDSIKSKGADHVL